MSPCAWEALVGFSLGIRTMESAYDALRRWALWYLGQDISMERIDLHLTTRILVQGWSFSDWSRQYQKIDRTHGRKAVVRLLHKALSKMENTQLESARQRFYDGSDG